MFRAYLPPDHPEMKLEEPQTVDTRGEKLCSACAGKPKLVTRPNFRHFTAANNNNNDDDDDGYQNNSTAQPERSSQLLHYNSRQFDPSPKIHANVILSSAQPSK